MWAVLSEARVDGPSWRVDGPSTRLVKTCARQHGLCWRVMETGHLSTRAVNSGGGNRAWPYFTSVQQHTWTLCTVEPREGRREGERWPGNCQEWSCRISSAGKWHCHKEEHLVSEIHVSIVSFSSWCICDTCVFSTFLPIKLKLLKSFPSHKGPLGGADLPFNSPKLQVHGHGASVSHGVPV